MVPCGSMEPLSPGPWSGLKRNTRVYNIHYTEKHALLVLFNSTTQTSERLLNSLYRVVLGGSGVVVSDPRGAIQALRRLFNGILSGARGFRGGP